MANILICDDAAFMRQALIKIVAAEGHTVVGEAANGEQCVSMYASLLPDIVLMDITMPDMDGIEATRRIVSADSSANIIIVSAMGQQDKVFAAIGAGAKDFIVKPFEAQKIVACIAKYI